jgi:diguanylate cyclase (GGDEF)-like protein
VTFGRIGGEEFAIVMRDSSSNELAKFCEECRKLIANIDSSPTGYDFSVSASFGVTSTTISGYVYSDLMTDADNAMYDAKAAGRNMVVNFQNNKIN